MAEQKVNMPTRVPIASSVFPATSSSGIPYTLMAAKNAQFSTYPDGRLYATQRTSVNIADFSGANSNGSGPNTAGTNGRGIFLWNYYFSGTTYTVTYLVNNDKIYTNNYGVANTTITAGRDPVYFFEIGNYLVMTDPQNNEMWYATKSASPTFTKMVVGTDPDWPFAVAGTMLAGGGAVLNGILYLMDTTGKIWNSASNNPTSWNGLDFIEASRSADGGIFLAPHHDAIAAIGPKTIEFFYDAGNPVASPLQRRDDVFYSIGALDRKRVYLNGDVVYFLGSEKSGTTGAFLLDNFSVNKISDDAIDRYIGFTLASSDYEIFTCASTFGEHNLFFITASPQLSSTYFSPVYTLVFDASTKTWASWEINTSLLTGSISSPCFPMIANSERGTGYVDSRFMLSNGDVIVRDLSGYMYDTKGAGGGYFTASDYIILQADYVLSLNYAAQSLLDFSLYTPEIDAGTLTNKFLYRMTLAGTVTTRALNTSDIYVSWTDDIYNTYSTPRALTTNNRRSLTRCGKFKRRAFLLNYAGEDRLLIEALELDLRMSNYA